MQILICKLRFLITIFLLFIMSFSLCAQELKDTITYNKLHKFPLLTLDQFYYPNTTFNTNIGQGEIEFNEQRLSIQAAIPLKDRKTYLFNSLNYTLIHYNTIFDQSSLTINESYHSIQYSLGLINILPKQWKLIFNLIPTLASDFHNSLSSEDFTFQISAMATKRSSQNVQYGFGLAYTSRFGNLTIIPLFSLTYKSDKWLTLAVLPAYVGQYFEFNDKYRLGIKAAVGGDLYNVDFDDISSPLNLNKFSYSRVTLGPEFLFKLIGDLYMNTGGGFTVRNVFEVQDKQQNKKLEFTFENRMFFNVGIRILK